MALDAACKEYYVAQQSLRRAEEEQTQLEVTLRRTADQVELRRGSLEKTRGILGEVLAEGERMRYLPGSVSPADAVKYVEEEKKLHTTIAVHDGATLEAQHTLEGHVKTIKSESRTVSVLEEALASQVNVNEGLHKEVREANANLKRTNARKVELLSRKETLAQNVHEQQVRIARLTSAYRARTASKSKAQDSVQNWDHDTLRLRKDTAFTRRMYLHEVEYGREQEVLLQQLLAENRKLKVIASNRNVKVPSRAEGMSFADENSNIEECPKTTQQQKALAAYRDHNVQLLQQLVGTLNILQHQLNDDAAPS